MKAFLIIVLSLVGFYVLVQAVILGYAFFVSKGVIAESLKFERVLLQAGTKILVLGDSTGFGVGAGSPDFSVAGRLGSEFPDASIINISQSGAKIEDVLEQIHTIRERDFDLILIQAGANDMLYFTDKDEAIKTLESVLLEAKKRSGKVVYTASGNIGATPIFMWPLWLFYEKRSEDFLTSFERVSEENDVSFVDLFNERDNDPFMQKPSHFYARDFVHPSPFGYELIYNEIKKNLPKNL